MPFLLHTSCLQIAFFLIRRPALLFAGNSRSPPQSPYPDMVPLRLFQILRYFPIWWLIGWVCLLPIKMSITDWFILCCFPLWYFAFPLPLLYYGNTEWGEMLEGPVAGKPLFLMTPLSRNTDTISYSFVFHHWAWSPLFSVLPCLHPSST